VPKSGALWFKGFFWGREKKDFGTAKGAKHAKTDAKVKKARNQFCSAGLTAEQRWLTA